LIIGSYYSYGSAESHHYLVVSVYALAISRMECGHQKITHKTEKKELMKRKAFGSIILIATGRSGLVLAIIGDFNDTNPRFRKMELEINV